jgi:hypothetical protein
MLFFGQFAAVGRSGLARHRDTVLGEAPDDWGRSSVPTRHGGPAHRAPQEAAMTTPHTSVIRILLADDHALVRRGVRLILDHRPAPFPVTDLGAPLTASV